jgi:MFS superfamily sulfate permease-like transporter
MKGKDLSEYKRKYHSFRHHAWAGLGFLSVVLAIRLLFIEQTQILTPIVVILAIYILVALFFTYIYRSGLSAPDQVEKVKVSDGVEKVRINAEVEKERLKLEKKKVKAESKAKKKEGKK